MHTNPLDSCCEWCPPNPRWDHGNPEDRYAVSVIERHHYCRSVMYQGKFQGPVVTLLKEKVKILCTIIGQRQRSVLLQGGLDIPCISFRGKKKLINKLKIIMKKHESSSITIMIV